MNDIVKEYIKRKYNKPGNVYLGLIHRLDRRVGGVMVFAKTSKAASRLSEDIRKHNFDSVDSARWLTSMQFGHLYRFNGHELCKYPGSEGCKEGEHLTRKFSAWRALKEWAEYSKYLDTF